MEDQTWNGARWWKFDFHTHTPASNDYGRGPDQATLKLRTPRQWLLDFMRAEVDCVAVTDHNSGEWVDPLRSALDELATDQPEGYRPLHLFAGVEISVHGGIHVLAILDLRKTTADINSLLGAVGYRHPKGASDGVTTKSFKDVLLEIETAGGIAIPAHVDQPSGLFTLQGQTLAQALECRELIALEVVDPKSTKPQLFVEKAGSRGPWTEVVGSDSHHPPGTGARKVPGSYFTWVKMGTPSLEGLRLALLDGSLSVHRSDSEDLQDPNHHAALLIESIEVSQARYLGRSGPFRLEFNPWLNALIGGRGTGKSTLVEFLRIALRREDELPPDFRDDFEKYTKVFPNRQDGGLMTDATEIRVVYRKDGARFRWQWSPSGDLDAIQRDVDGTWQRGLGIALHFPARLFSQKQIFHMANAPSALLNVVDEASRVGKGPWQLLNTEEENRFLSLRAKARELDAGLAEEPRFQGDLDDVKRKLAIFEESSHPEVLKAFQMRQRQERALEGWESEWSTSANRLREVAQELVPNPLDEVLKTDGSKEDSELLELASSALSQLHDLREAVEGLAETADSIVSSWKRVKRESRWSQAIGDAVGAYESLKERLSNEGAGDPSEYGALVQRRQSIEHRLEGLDNHRKEAEALGEQAEASLLRLLEFRRGLTESRRSFLREVLTDNQYVRIEVVPYGARDLAQTEFRRLVQREDGSFEKDIGSPDEDGFLGQIYGNGSDPKSIEAGLSDVKQEIRQIVAGHTEPRGDQRFSTHLARLSPEVLDRIDLWFPQDSLDVQYSPEGDGRNFRSIREGSPGQKTAALLAFLLSYGDEPLVLDQPEDDLDNHLIYELIVTQLREVKLRRQIIVVTHNPNIVVNGDAELVIALQSPYGETLKECEGSLQEKSVRDTICRVMEGGRKAFTRRFERIALEGRHV